MPSACSPSAWVPSRAWRVPRLDVLQPVSVAISPSGPLNLSLQPIPHDRRLIVVAEVHAGNDLNSALLFYGESETFVLEAGQDRQLVTVALRRPPGSSSVGVVMTNEVRATEVFVNTPDITLEVTSDTGVMARLSNFDGVSDVDVPLGQPIDANCERVQQSANPCRFRVPWNLEEGLAAEARCRGRDVCTRGVSVQLVDAANFASAAETVTVTLDERAPSLLGTEVRLVVEDVDGNLLSRVGLTVSAIREGTRARVTIVPSETLGVPPVIEAVNGDQVMTLAEPALVDTAYSVVDTLASLPEGTWSFRATLTDRAGNVATVDLPETVVVDRSPPSTPDVLTERRIFFQREPWGSDASEGVPRLRLLGGPGAVEANATLFASTSSTSEIIVDEVEVVLSQTASIAPQQYVSAVDGRELFFLLRTLGHDGRPEGATVAVDNLETRVRYRLDDG